MPLIHEGDTTDNFGRFLPTPFIEKILIDDNGYELTFAVFLTVTDDQCIDEYKDWLNRELIFNAMLAYNKPSAPVQQLINGKNVFKYYQEAQTTNSDTSNILFQQLDFFSSDHTDEFFDSDGNRVLKFQAVLDGNSSHPPPVTKQRDGDTDLYGDDWEIANQSAPDPNPCGDVDTGLYYDPDTTACTMMEVWCTNTYGEDYGFWDRSQYKCVDSMGLDPAEDDVTGGEEDFETTGPDYSDSTELLDRCDTSADCQTGFVCKDGVCSSDTTDTDTTDTVWDDITSFYVFAFSTTFNYNGATADEIEEKLEYPQLFNKEISGVSYETVFENGIIADQLQIEFFGRKGEIYNGIPLQSTSGKYYKTTKVTHDEVVGFFDKLIDEFKSATENIKTPLQRMINQISYVLEIYPEDITLLRRLNALRRAFPSKGGATPLGKLYKRFSRRISTLNKKLYNSPEVIKKIIRNAKIFDMRSPAPLTYTAPDIHISPSERNDQYYIYNSSFMGRTAMYSSVTGQQHTEGYAGASADETSTTVYAAPSDLDRYDVIVRQFGYFFFDYEKALKKLSNVTEVVDISKLLIYGIDLPYEHFKVTRVSLYRFHGGASTTYAYIYSEMGSEGYPVTGKTIIDAYETIGIAWPSPGFYSDYESEQATLVAEGVSDAAMTEEGNLVLTEEEHMYLIHRNFEPVDKDGEITGLTPNYRLMCFEFQDFMDDDIAVEDTNKEYVITIEIEDNSIKMLTTLMDKFQTSINKLRDYYNKASEQFSYDEETGIFNEFFTEGMTNLYKGEEVEAPWHRAAVLYNIHRDLVYNYFGGNLSNILADSQIIINNINPVNGSFYALEDFYNKISDFYKNTYEEGSVAYQISSLSDIEGYTFEIENTLSYDSAGNSNADEISDMIYGTIYT